MAPEPCSVEKPSKPWFTSAGRPSAEFTQALEQLADWKVGFHDPSNQQIFRNTYLGEDKFLNRQLLPQYVLVYGRAAEFDPDASPHNNPDALRLKRDFMRRSGEAFITFDSLRPDPKLRDAITVTQTPDGPVLHAVAPTFSPGPTLMKTTTRITRYEDGLARSVHLEDDRREYLGTRWMHWRQEQAERVGREGPAIRSFGRE